MSLSLKDHLSDAGIAKWVAEVGCTDAPIPRRNIKVALHFFDEKMPALPIADAVGFIAAMDLSKAVNRVFLHPGDQVIGFRTGSESPFKLFFARRGASAHRSGINTANRGVVHFKVRVAIQVLESFTTAAIDTWTRRDPGQTTTVAPRAKKWFGREHEFGVMVRGGGAQLIIPESYNTLLVETAVHS
jgi:hypothetical protein